MTGIGSRLSALAAALVIGLAGCSVQTSNLGSDAELNQRADAMFSDLTEGRDDALIARMSSASDPATIRAQLPLLRTLVAAGDPPAATVTGSSSYAGLNGQIYMVTQDYAYPDRVAHVETTFLKEDGDWKVEGVNVNVTLAAVVPANPPATAPAVAGVLG